MTKSLTTAVKRAGAWPSPQWRTKFDRRKRRQTILELFDSGREPTPLNDLARACHKANATWWHHPRTGRPLKRNKGELLMLIVSEIAEAMEGERKDLMDDKLPHRKMAEVELADALIRIFDYAGAYGLDLDGAVAEKRAFNARRPDHKPAARLKKGGKKW